MNTGRHYRSMSATLERQSAIICYLFIALCISLSINVTQLAYNGGNTYAPATHITQNTISGIETLKTPFERIVEIKSSRSMVITPEVIIEEKVEEPLNEVVPVPEGTVNIDETPVVEEKPIAVEPTPVVEEPPKVVHPETQILSNEIVEREKLTQAIKEIAPALLGCEDAIIYNYEQYGLKPSFQLAVFCLESGYGTSNLANNKNNISSERAYASKGMTAYEHAKSFDTKSDCVLSFGKLMVKNYNLNSLQSVASKYCPPNKDKWVSSVNSLMKRFDAII